MDKDFTALRAKDAANERRIFWSEIAILAIVAALLALSFAGSAFAQQGCDVEEAQRLFGQQPRPTNDVQRLLTACEAAGSTDYRVYMFKGVMARDAGDRAAAATALRKARAMAPNEVNPALELAVTLEPDDSEGARAIYEEILARDPASRPALLGLARVARSDNKLDQARDIYQKLLAANPKDTDALNGMAWLALAHNERLEGIKGFNEVLAIDPGNHEARVGLEMAPHTYRYSFDASGTMVSTTLGTSWGLGGLGRVNVSPYDSIEIGETHYTEEIATLTGAGVSVLPSDDVHVGYIRQVPLSYTASLSYDYRGHATSGLPAEHWIDGGFTLFLTDDIRWFGGYREALGGYQWDGRLIRTGMSASLSDSFEVIATAFNAAQAIFNNYQPIWSGTFDVAYHGDRGLLIVAGVGYAPLIDNVDLHARALVPVTDRIAVQIGSAHNSINADTRVTLGLRFTW